MAIKNMTKATIDKKIQNIISLKARISALKEQLNTETNSIEAMYVEDNSVDEVIYGKEYQAKKTPVNRGKHNYNVAKVKKILSGLQKEQAKGVVKTVRIVDSNAFELLEKQGFVPASMLDDAREDNFTFKVIFSKIEKEAQTEVKKAVAAKA